MMKRPDPDTLLARVQQEENHAKKGRLKVFFGMAPGVGKTYAMLSEARERVNARVLVGVIETHGRQDTQALLDGLEILPLRTQEHNGVTLREFDLDAALQCHPDVLLVDELAHTNAPGSRHAKRWQDVEELLDAGIDVYTTVNVQHLESLNDVVAQITGVQVRETVPDHVVERAHDIELIDLTPAELQARLREGKVYVPQSVEQALKNFFREGNLIALRELALRRTAERVDAQMQTYRRDHAVPQTWPACERIVVCVGPNPLSGRLVRAARRMATGLHAQWLVAWVETPTPLPEAARERVQNTLRLAESLGAETVQLAGNDVAAELLAFARERNVSKIVVGKPAKPRWREKLFGSIVDEIVRGSGDIDVYVITGDSALPDARRKILNTTSGAPIAPYGYVGAVGIIALCTLVAWAMHRTFSPPNLTMIYLVGVVLAAARLGRGPSVVVALGGVAAYDFFFVPPYYTFAVSDVQYLVTFAVLLSTGLIISTLTARVQQAAEAARSREQRTAALYSLTRDLAATRGVDNIVQVALGHTQELAAAPVVAWLPNGDGIQARVLGDEASFTHDPKEEGVARWVFDHANMAGAGTDTLPAAHAIYLPLKGTHAVEGVLGVQLRGEADTSRPVSLSPDRLHSLETLAAQVALALERARLADEAQDARLQVETERLRNSLLSSVSHDLRTPLASIMGASSSLLDTTANLPETTRHDLLHSIGDEAARLHRLVSNLLEMTRLQSGAVRVNKEWQPLEEVVGATLSRLKAALQGRVVTTALPADLPLVPLDATLIEQVFINLLENALKYSPPGSPIHIAALRGHDAVMVEVSDRGPGLPPDSENAVFDPFFRATQAQGGHADGQAAVVGAGLGLAICRAIVEAHGGAIWAENRPRGGAVFRFTLPLDGQPPELKGEG